MIAFSLMKRLYVVFLYLLCIFYLATAFLFPSTYAQGMMVEVLESDPTEISYIPAKVLNVRDITPPAEPSAEQTERYLPNETVKRLWVQLLSGPYQGNRIFIEHRSGGSWSQSMFPGYNFDGLQEGDRILLYVSIEDGKIKSAHIENHLRSPWLFYLFVIFVLLMLLIAGLKGFKALISIVLTAAGIIWILLPLILKGYNPILIAILLSISISVITFILLNGWSRKTMAAIAGTTGGFVVAGFLSYGTGLMANLTGFNSEEVGMLRYIPQSVSFNFQGILFAGIIIGALGAIMDVAMSIASSMDELYQHHPGISFQKHVRSGINIGKDIIGTMSNTLILAYTGSSIPLMLLFLAYRMPYLRLLNLDIIATEIVRALSGTIGLTITVPITVLAAAFLCRKFSQKQSE